MKPCIAIPIYNHGATIVRVVESLSSLGLPCIIVNDGSDSETCEQLEVLERRFDWVQVVHHEMNRGRGAALRTAYQTAAAAGMTHVVQLDADGQHCADDIPLFLDAAKAQPDALVLGEPVFDHSIPWHRLHGRKLSQGIVWLETWSRAVHDPLCGFRCIPLAATLSLLDDCRTGDRMDFDPEIIIRLVRSGVPVVNIPTRVQYPEQGVSHFRMVEDNLRIAWAYIRLLFVSGRGRPVDARAAAETGKTGETDKTDKTGKAGTGWASVAESGSAFALSFVVWLIRSVVGGGPIRLLVAPISAYFFVASGTARRASRDYLARVDRARGGSGRVRWLDPYRHIYCFAEVFLDRLELWGGKADFRYVLHGRENMQQLVEERRGAFLIGAHIGSFDMLRVIAREADIPVNVLMYSRNAARINEALEKLDPDNKVRLIDLDPSSPKTAFEIRRCLSRGEFVAVLSDRVLPTARGRVTLTNFLGGLAAFPQGPFLLSLVLRVPLILTVALRTGRREYDVHLEKLSDGEPVPAKEREKVVQALVETFAARLEHYCMKAPLQWFNFYDFWSGGHDVRK